MTSRQDDLSLVLRADALDERIFELGARSDLVVLREHVQQWHPDALQNE